MGNVIDGLIDGGTSLELAEILGEAPVTESTANYKGPRVSGSLAAQYAPDTPMRLLCAAELDQALQELLPDQPVAVLAFRMPKAVSPNYRWRLMPTQPKQYAQTLYASLRESDMPIVAA